MAKHLHLAGLKNTLNTIKNQETTSFNNVLYLKTIKISFPT
jgi:hypothetical protein